MGQDRRRFIRNLGLLGAASSVPAPTLAADTHTMPAQHAPKAKRGSASSAQDGAYLYLTQPEVAFVEAAVAHLIPKDELGPGAKEAGVAYFIDRQLFGGYGTMAKKYRQGPWPEGTPQQGYQSPLTPQEVYRAAIRDINEHCGKQYGKRFDALGTAQQEEVLHGLDAGKIELASVRAPFFFNMLLGNTIEGYFSDPVYGGNRDKIGWKVVGFPGVAAAYTALVEKYNAPYRVVPVSIVDVEQGHAQLDEHGHPVHVMLDDRAEG